MEVSVVEVEDEEEDGDEAPENDLTKQIREEHTSIILKLDGSINEKEKLLAAIKESQTQMQNDLISLMKNQYHQKVLELTNEITNLERKKSESLGKTQISQNERKKLEEQFRAKQRDLEDQLKDLKEKNK